MSVFITCAILTAGGLALGLHHGVRRAAGPLSAVLLAAGVAAGCVLGRWVVRIDLDGTGYAVLPQPWSWILSVLAIALILLIPVSFGFFAGLSAWDFAGHRRRRVLRLACYLFVVGTLTYWAPWVFGVTFD